jgi:hypothetical protein
MFYDKVVLSEGFELVQVVSESQKCLMAQMLIQMNWWLFGSSTLVVLMLLRHKERVMSTIRKYNTLAGNKNLVFCEKFSQQCIANIPLYQPMFSIFPTKLVLSTKLVTVINVAVSSMYTNNSYSSMVLLFITS